MLKVKDKNKKEIDWARKEFGQGIYIRSR